MHGLPELQRALQRHLFDADAPDQGLPIKANGLTPARRLQVYRNNVFSNLTAALRDVHPVVARLVGDGFFAFCADTYIRRFPSRSGDLQRFGDGFAAFLRGFAPARSLDYLPEVAALEWYYHEAFHAADAAPLDLTALAVVAPDDYAQLRLNLHPSVRLLRAAYPVVDIWRVNQPDCDGEPVVDLDAGGGQWLIWRSPANEVELVALPAPEFDWLQALRDGRPLQDAVDAVADPAFELDQALLRLVGCGVICGFERPGHEPPTSA